MKKIEFVKIVGSGNDFVAIVGHKSQVTSHKLLARKLCDRKYGIGADGALFLEKSNKADVKMRIFNADGSEADMCGNGARCVALYTSRKLQVPPLNRRLAGTCLSGRQASHKIIKIETKAGIIESEVWESLVRIKLTEPKNIKLDIPLKVNGRILKVNFVNTGVPHAVVFVQGLDKIDVQGLGRQIRNHKEFAPFGANVNFVEVKNDDTVAVRTFERGVEGETLACGTGSVASAAIFALKSGQGEKVKVSTRGGEILKVYFSRKDNKFSDAWLEGRVRIICKGEYYV